MSGFKICDNKGFHITLANGWTLSVQFGGGNYCDNYDFPIGQEREGRGMKSSNAEMAIMDPKGSMQEFPESGDTVIGRQTPAQMLEFLNMIAAKP